MCFILSSFLCTIYSKSLVLVSSNHCKIFCTGTILNSGQANPSITVMSCNFANSTFYIKIYVRITSKIWNILSVWTKNRQFPACNLHWLPLFIFRYNHGNQGQCVGCLCLQDSSLLTLLTPQMTTEPRIIPIESTDRNFNVNHGNGNSLDDPSRKPSYVGLSCAVSGYSSFIRYTSPSRKNSPPQTFRVSTEPQTLDCTNDYNLNMRNQHSVVSWVF